MTTSARGPSRAATAETWSAKAAVASDSMPRAAGSGTPRRHGRSGRPGRGPGGGGGTSRLLGSLGSGPAMAPMAAAATPTDRANIDTVSNDGDAGTTPVLGTSP